MENVEDILTEALNSAAFKYGLNVRFSDRTAEAIMQFLLEHGYKITKSED